MGWEDWAETLGGVVGIGVGMTSKSRSTAENQKNDRNSAESKAQQQYDDQRRSANTNYDQLKSEHTAGYDAPVVVGDKREAFNTWKHSKIWDTLTDAANPTNASTINDAATTWKTLADNLDTARNDFTKNVDQSVSEKMKGKSAGAFIDSSHQFATELGKLTVAQRLVARGLAYHADYLGQAKASISAPPGSGGITDKVVEHLPLQSVFKGPHYRQQEAEHEAQRVMSDVYQKNVINDVDSSRPILPTPSSSVSGNALSGNGISSSVPGNSWTSSSSGGGNGWTNASGVGSGSGGDSSGNSNSGTSGTSSSPASYTGTSGNTSTAGYQNPSLSSSLSGLNTTPSNYSGTGGGTGGDYSGFGGGTNSSTGGGAGKSIPGTNSTGTKTPTAATTSAKSNNMSNMTGMPHAGKSKQDEEGTVSRKDYLVYDRGSELLGTQPPALPPGGVIGG
ncbi:hypothetical protein [Nocardia macrotermitis]|uniref:PPE family domain-containing protein n=1 Tax=Nocardia macrotermitis TaxID=2585198 RepID=A0A7K0CX69_9NOCA|nr:hypothetical protein [Nocardia macrotermitis]MQY18107.1 hypothetical protein [Nocardia macrotermitis]